MLVRNLQFAQNLFSQLNTTGFSAKAALNDPDFIEWEYAQELMYWEVIREV